MNHRTVFLKLFLKQGRERESSVLEHFTVTHQSLAFILKYLPTTHKTSALILSTRDKHTNKQHIYTHAKKLVTSRYKFLL